MSHCTVAVCVCVLCIAAVGVGETSDWLDSVSQSLSSVEVVQGSATPKTSSVVLEHQKLRYVSLLSSHGANYRSNLLASCSGLNTNIIYNIICSFFNYIVSNGVTVDDEVKFIFAEKFEEDTLVY